MPSSVIPLARNVYRIPTAPFDLVNSFALVEDDGSVTLVDCGVAGAPPRIVAALALLGKAPVDVQRIVLTHAHSDHAGGAAVMAQRTGVGAVQVHADDAERIRFGTPAPTDPATRLGRVFVRLIGGRRGFTPVDVDKELVDGEVLPVAGGLRVVHTPGHSPGHVSLLHEPSGVLITGDAIFNVRGLHWPARALCTDIVLNQRTAHLLGELEYTTAAFTHGPHVSDRARDQVRAFLAEASLSP